MKRRPPTQTVPIAAVVVASGLFLSGCGGNEAREAPVADGGPQTAEVGIDVRSDGGAPFAGTNPEAREAALVQGEQELAALEENLDARVEELETRLAEIESREASLSVREGGPPEIDVAAVETEAWDSAAELSAVETPPEPDPEPRIVMLGLPAGTTLALELRDAVSSEISMVGDPVRAVIAEDVIADGRIAIPAGSEVFGTLVDVQPQKKIGGQARLAILFDGIEMTDGYRAAIEASFGAEGRRQKKKDAATIGGSAAGGALLGRILSKNDKTKGTVIGGVLGAAIGAAVASENRGDPVVFEPGARLVAQLDLPIHIAVADTAEPRLVSAD